MRRTIFALFVALLAAAAWATGASADSTPAPAAPSTQTAGQIATNDQSADSSATSAQVAPSNTNVNVRVLSPGSNGPVSQNNASTAGALAGNVNLTGQGIDQAGGASQQAGQAAGSSQDASAAAESAQVKPQNTNVYVRVLSPGDDGPVSQANTSTAAAIAGNLNATGQDIGQSAHGGPGGQQDAGQEAYSGQGASATAGSLQVEPSNTNVGVSVLSPGSGGSVSQSNASTALGAAGNANLTKQSIDQSAGGGHPWLGTSHDGGAGVGVQAAGQLAVNKQDAAACATSVQIKPENTNLSNGSVKQDNTSTAIGAAANLNGLSQTIGQNPDGKTAVHGADDPAGQAAAAPAKPADGVSQSNTSTALSLSANLNLTHQSISQQQDGRPSDVNVQAAGQAAGNEQHATSNAASLQVAPTNRNGGIGVSMPLCPKPAPPVCAPLRRGEVVPVT